MQHFVRAHAGLVPDEVDIRAHIRTAGTARRTPGSTPTSRSVIAG
jgi:hypothetical protein